jgi:hypothetical protein
VRAPAMVGSITIELQRAAQLQSRALLAELAPQST